MDVIDEIDDLDEFEQDDKQPTTPSFPPNDPEYNHTHLSDSESSDDSDDSSESDGMKHLFKNQMGKAYPFHVLTKPELEYMLIKNDENDVHWYIGKEMCRNKKNFDILQKIRLNVEYILSVIKDSHEKFDFKDKPTFQYRMGELITLIDGNISRLMSSATQKATMYSKIMDNPQTKQLSDDLLNRTLDFSKLDKSDFTFILRAPNDLQQKYLESIKQYYFEFIGNITKANVIKSKKLAKSLLDASQGHSHSVMYAELLKYEALLNDLEKTYTTIHQTTLLPSPSHRTKRKAIEQEEGDEEEGEEGGASKYESFDDLSEQYHKSKRATLNYFGQNNVDDDNDDDDDDDDNDDDDEDMGTKYFSLIDQQYVSQKWLHNHPHHIIINTQLLKDNIKSTEEYGHLFKPTTNKRVHQQFSELMKLPNFLIYQSRDQVFEGHEKLKDCRIDDISDPSPDNRLNNPLYISIPTIPMVAMIDDHERDLKPKQIYEIDEIQLIKLIPIKYSSLRHTKDVQQRSQRNDRVYGVYPDHVQHLLYRYSKKWDHLINWYLIHSQSDAFFDMPQFQKPIQEQIEYRKSRFRLPTTKDDIIADIKNIIQTFDRAFKTDGDYLGYDENDLIVYRGFRFREDIKYPEDLDKFVWKNYLSTTIDYDTAMKFAGNPDQGFVMKIKVPKNARFFIMNNASHYNEKELLFPRNCVTKYISESFFELEMPQGIQALRPPIPCKPYIQVSLLKHNPNQRSKLIGGHAFHRGCTKIVNQFVHFHNPEDRYNSVMRFMGGFLHDDILKIIQKNNH